MLTDTNSFLDARRKSSAESNIDEEIYGRDGARNGLMISALELELGLLWFLQYCSRMFGSPNSFRVFATCHSVVASGQDLYWTR